MISKALCEICETISAGYYSCSHYNSLRGITRMVLFMILDFSDECRERQPHKIDSHAWVFTQKTIAARIYMQHECEKGALAFSAWAVSPDCYRKLNIHININVLKVMPLAPNFVSIFNSSSVFGWSFSPSLHIWQESLQSGSFNMLVIVFFE